MWEPYRLGITEEFPEATLTFDRYHVVTLSNRAVDLVRRKEVRTVPLLKSSRWLWLRGRRKMTENQRSDLSWLSRPYTRTGKAYQIKLTLQRLWNLRNRADAETFLKRWYFWATHSRLEPVIKAANTIKRHWQGIFQFVDSRITTGDRAEVEWQDQNGDEEGVRLQVLRVPATVIYIVTSKIN